MQYFNLSECFNPPTGPIGQIEHFTPNPNNPTSEQRTVIPKGVRMTPRSPSPIPKSPTPIPKLPTPIPKSPTPQTKQRVRKQPKGSKPKIILPKPVRKPTGDKPAPPVELPSNVSRDDWWPWWRKNRYYYGSRDYYFDLGYPGWWLDYYYPEWDTYDDYIYDDDYSVPVIYSQPQTTIIQQTPQQQIQEPQTQQQQSQSRYDYPSTIEPLAPLMLMFSGFGFLIMIIFIIFLLKK